MTAAFRARLSRIAKTNGRVILAADYDGGGGGNGDGLEARAISDIGRLHPYICAVKLNLHLLLPLGARAIAGITGAAHGFGLQAVADIKLNDIGNTNRVATERLWAMGFDAVIANPIMGPDALGDLAARAHGRGNGVIALCHMSAPEARPAYDMEVGPGGSGAGGAGTARGGSRRAYQLFLEWALAAGADGIVAGATFPEIIRYCAGRAGGRLDIFSPGVGAQGGSAGGAASAGSDYLIVGRTILGADDPVRAAEGMSLQSLGRGAR